MQKKRVSDSYTEQVQLLTKANMNGYDRLFGGTLMEWIDIVAGVVARRHSGRNVTTVLVDTLNFTAPAYANDCILIKGRITYAGNTSMEILVKTYVEHLSGERKLINKAYVVMVALDEHEKPVKIPGLILESDREKELWAKAERRNKLRKKRRKENY